MQPLWKIRSGNFAGYSSDDALYDANGNNVGYFRDDVAYSNDGHCLGEIYENDWIGKRTSIVYPIGSSRVGRVGIARAAQVGRIGLAIAGWVDPDF